MTDIKLSPAQRRSLLSGLANTSTRRLEGRPVTNRSLVSLDLAYYSPANECYKLNEPGYELAVKLRAEDRAKQLIQDAWVVRDHQPEGTTPIYARDVQEDMVIWDSTEFRTVETVTVYEESPYTAAHWARLRLARTEVRLSDVRTMNPDFVVFVKAAETAEEA